MGIKNDFAEYWGNCFKWAGARKWGVDAVMNIIFVILALSGIGGIYFWIQENSLIYLWLLVPFVLLLLVIAPFVVWRKERIKVREYEKIDLEMIIGNSAQFIHKRGDNWIFRIGIKTNGRKSVDNVEVVISQRNGEEHAFPDAPLRPAYSLPNDSGSFPVKPDDINFVEVCSWNRGSPEMRMHYHTSYQIILKYYDEKTKQLPDIIAPFVLPDGIPIAETITLCATGDNVRAICKTLRINTSGKEPLWEEVKCIGKDL